MIIKRDSSAVRWLVLVLAGLMVMVFCAPEIEAASFTKTCPKGVVATAVNESIAVTWESQSGAKGYYVYESVNGGSFVRIMDTEAKKIIRKEMKRGSRYGYYVVAYKKTLLGKIKKGKKSKKVYTTVAPSGKSTIKNFLSTALAPVGSTMYIWGGTWRKSQKPDKNDDATGKYGNNTGIPKEWRTFAAKQKSSYNWKNTKYMIHKGADCSGYVGWAVYQVNQVKNNKAGYVTYADEEGMVYAKKKLGSWNPKGAYPKWNYKPKNYKAGDIMCSGEHTYIVIGKCSDGSLVIVHASPPGVKISGTYSSSGVKYSKAAKLAEKYMKKYYKSWYSRYPESSLRYGDTYLRGYGQFRWKGSVLSDPDGYKNKSAEQILKDLFSGK